MVETYCQISQEDVARAVALLPYRIYGPYLSSTPEKDRWPHEVKVGEVVDEVFRLLRPALRADVGDFLLRRLQRGRFWNPGADAVARPLR